MIPLRLEIKNFLPYRTPDVLLFEGIHLACLTGHNGAGKSALLDAITYALWGRARGSARSDQPLIHQGQKEMSVLLDFEQEGEKYRVVRGRSERNQGNLSFYQHTESDGWQNRNGQNMGDTDRIIREALRLDYETFVNSAFLQQGRADAFTTKTPAERKKILGEILGLEQWAVYEERAKSAIQESQRMIGNLEHETRNLNDELKRETQYKREFESAEQTMQKAQAERDEAQAKLDEVSYVEQALREKRVEMERKTRDQNELVKEQAALKTQIDQLTTEIARCDAVIVQAETIENGYQTLQQARDLDSSLGEKLSQSSALQTKINGVEKAIQKIYADLEQDRRAAAGQMLELERQIEEGLAERLVEVEGRIAELEHVEKEREAINTESQKTRELVIGARNALSAAEAEGKKRSQHLDRVRALDGATCPLCGQALTQEHVAAVTAELEAELEDRRSAYQGMKEQIRINELRQKELDEQKEALASRLAELPRLRKEHGGLTQKYEASQKAAQRLITLQSEHDAIRTRIDEEDYAQQERADLASLYAERDALGYDGEAHNSARANLQQYRDFETQQRDLELARLQRPGLQSQLDTHQTRQTRVQTVLTEMTSELDEIKTRLLELEQLQIEFRLREREVLRLAGVLNEAQQRLGGARQRLENLERVRDRLKEIDVQLDDVRITRSLYEQLQRAFSKKGIPAMMIETALPELELEANRLLSRMTDGRMHVSLKTQRATQAGDTTETLDIDISDELGTRSYDLYSGGEAFRINFALRVALSKMLARRAGAQLRTLFIDEGFGTQDEDGRGRLVEAINVVQDDFDLILVITHLDELRDSFPVHIVVEKTTNGSGISVR